MTPRDLRRRQKDVYDAQNVLKTLPNFPSVQVEVMDAMDEVKASMSNCLSSPFPALKRLDYAIAMLDVKAKAYLKLVSNMATQEAFMTVLYEFGRGAWDDYTGIHGIEVAPGDSRVQAIQERVRYWQRESYQRIIPQGEAVKDAAKEEAPPGTADQSVSESMESIVAEREEMLAKYKAATKDSSNRKIYTAKNSGIHKPEFYAWVNGVLPRTSSTCQNFERFLRERKAPIPRPKG